MDELLDGIILKLLHKDTQGDEHIEYGARSVRHVFFLLCNNSVSQKISSNPRFISSDKYPIPKLFDQEIGAFSYLRILESAKCEDNMIYAHMFIENGRELQFRNIEDDIINKGIKEECTT